MTKYYRNDFKSVSRLIEITTILLFALPKVVRQQFVGEVGTSIFFDINFPQDVTYHKLLTVVALFLSTLYVQRVGLCQN